MAKRGQLVTTASGANDGHIPRTRAIIRLPCRQQRQVHGGIGIDVAIIELDDLNDPALAGDKLPERPPAFAAKKTARHAERQAAAGGQHFQSALDEEHVEVELPGTGGREPAPVVLDLVRMAFVQLLNPHKGRAAENDVRLMRCCSARAKEVRARDAPGKVRHSAGVFMVGALVNTIPPYRQQEALDGERRGDLIDVTAMDARGQQTQLLWQAQRLDRTRHKAKGRNQECPATAGWIEDAQLICPDTPLFGHKA